MSCGCPGSWDITFRFNGVDYHEYVSGYEWDNPFLKTISGKDYLYSACDDRDMRGGLVWANSPGIAPIVATAFTKTDPNCVSSQSYDCINGACIVSTQYDTPGIYASLAECETACGTGCSGKCISNSEWATIEGLSNQLKQRNCS
ncbi:hypothetical protein H6G33_04215 [Calothrix sp. FACHB-1219]|uniref:hypothetical protein n=1 Tax=unclassified Calothrix TaxID=2619626 RepID=UPI0016848E5D|nr:MULTISPECIES: hypothetical protein [unclassified Calothrix]MBD2204942.1 hypothetical protein [Calothrix sp. FACHB-168]MBD2216233.1 hypothetical protein [Calothrix sp. FACHB-1219]